MMKTLKDFYSRHNPNQKLGGGSFRSDLIAEWAGRNNMILDIGCGEGYEAYPLLQSGNRVYGVEIATWAAREAKKRGVKTIRADITRAPLPFANEYFDVIIAGEIIEHVLDTDGLLQEMKNKLKPDGILIITTPNIASLARRLLLLFGINPFCEYSLEEKILGHNPVGHIRYFTRSNLLGLLRKHGYRVEKSVSDRINLGFFSSHFLSRIFPGLGYRFIVKARKVMQD